MRDYFDPPYFSSSLKGPNSSQGSSRPVKKSHSVVGSSNGGNVFGRFLKLGKSKSDVQGKSRPSSTYNDDLEEDFRLSPSVLNRGPVEKMVHKSTRKDVSRSHSWIYGSVKLPSDLPFGYGYSPTGSESNSGESVSPNTRNGQTGLQIPRCQMMDYYSSCGECTCGGEFDPGDGSSIYAGSSNKPCKACAYEWALGGRKNGKSRKRDSSAEGFVNSVRKLTWKSLKQAVKKRPSLDNIKKQEEFQVGVGGYEAQQIPLSPEMSNFDPNGMDLHNRMNGFFSYSQNAFSADDLQPSYFFPEKKNMYASCTELFRDAIPQATASVRVRPKPARQSWQFTNESGPVPNYQEDSIYHSEWDLRQCIPYDVWVSTTSHVKPRTTLPPPRSKTPNAETSTSRNSSLSKSTSVPYLSELQDNSSTAHGYKTEYGSCSNLKVKSSSSGAVNNNYSDTVSLRSVASSVKTSGSGSVRQNKPNGVVKRPSILSADINAYQLLKAQSKSANSSYSNTPTVQDGNDDALSNSSDDLSDNALTDSHMRIAGQKIYMPPNVNGNQSSSANHSSTFFNGKSGNESNKTNGTSKNANNRVPPRQESHSSSSSSRDDEWTSEIQSQHRSQSKHVSMSRDGSLQHPDKANKALRNSNKSGQPNKTQQQVHYQESEVGTRASPNNCNYDNYRENNGIRSSPNNMIENINSASPNQRSLITNYEHHNNDGQSQTQRDYDSEGNYQVEFEEFVFEDRTTDNSNTHKLKAWDNDGLKSSANPKPNNNGIRNPMANSTSRQTTFLKNGQNNGNKRSSNNTTLTESAEVSSAPTLGSNNSKSNGPGKFGALRRRKSRNGSSSPGALLREVIYEEEVEHEHSALDSISQLGFKTNITTPSQRSSNKSKEHVVKIAVSHSPGTTDYVKPILKNRERVYDTPINGPFSSERDYSSNSANHGINDIYFDSSISTTSTLKKKVQFDQNKVIVCGGDSGPDETESDDCGIDEDDNDAKRERNQEKSDDRDDNYGNEENVSYEEKSNQSNGGHYNKPNQSHKESGSVSLKSNLSRKSVLVDNHDDSSPNQSLRENRRSTFEEEVARKAASFALTRSKKKEAEEEASRLNNANNAEEEEQSKKECFDGNGKVNNLQLLQLNESRFTSTNNPALAKTTTANMTKKKSSLKSNCKSPEPKASQGTIPDSAQPMDNNAGPTIGKERHFTKNVKASYGVASQIMKAKRIAVGKNFVNEGQQQQQEKIVNPNSLLFNDTTRIRLQSRPSMNETFKLNLSQNGQGNRYGSSPTGGKGVRLKQSSSFRTLGSVPLRPKEPPPPPPPATPTTSKSSATSRLQMSISSSISGQLDKLLSSSKFSSSSNQIYGGSLNGSRLLSKSEISLPMDLQTTSNQASRVIKNQNTHGQKANGISISNHNNSSKSSGFEAKTSVRSSPNPTNANVEYKKIDANANNAKSKSLSDRCETLDKMVGQHNTTKSNANTSSDNKSINNNKSLTSNRGRNEEILVGKIKQTNNQGSLKSSLKQIPTKLNQQKSPNANAQSENQNIEIVTKENAVSEIRIYSSTSPIVGSNNNAVNNVGDNKMNHEPNNTVITTQTKKQEIHYAATDIFPHNKEFRQPAALLPPIPQESIVAPSRPQSTSVVLILDSNLNNGSISRTSKVTESSSPLTYCQPIDVVVKPPNPSPLTPSINKEFPSSTNHELPDDNETECEPLYDDVIHHQKSTADKTASNIGSLGRKFLMTSLRPNKQLTLAQDINNKSAGQNAQPQVVSSTLPCMACPPSLPPPNLPSKNLSEFTNRPIVLKEELVEEVSYCDIRNDQNLQLDEEVDNLYNDISDGGVNNGKSLQSFASSMKGALLNAIKNMDFDRRSIISNMSNNSGGSQNTSKSVKQDYKGNETTCNLDNFIYDDTLSLRSGNSEEGSKKSSASNRFKLFDSTSLKSSKSFAQFPPAPSSIRSSSSTIKQLDNLLEQDQNDNNEPLYDDVINYSQTQNGTLKNGVDNNSHSSDSGAESEDAIPPPLPAQGPPKMSTELPLLTFPLLMNRNANTLSSRGSITSNEKVIDIVLPSKTSVQGPSNASNPSKEHQDAVLTRTRSLLNELNEKLSQLNTLTNEAASASSSPSNNGKELPPLEFSTYSSNRIAVLSSSESSGVEEDYNSEKNYSLSNSSDGASGTSSSAEENYKLAQVTKLVTETITMARGKFLDSMKSNSSLSLNNSSTNNQIAMLSSPVSRDSGSSPCVSDEPIYEEIGDMNRSHSPIYADAFDAKSIFEGASRSEILSFLESIRDRLTPSDSNSSGSQSSSISSKKGQDSEKNYQSQENVSTLIPGDICHLPTHAEEEPEELLISQNNNKLVLRKLCPDCNDVPIDQVDKMETDENANNLICHSCHRKRNERKEIITEIHETEMKYGRDLQIISEEFYKPIQIAGLLNKEQLDQIFLNTLELMGVSAQLTTMLKAELQSAIVERRDEDFVTVNIGKIFLEIGESMMTIFQTYCTRQASAGALLAQLEKEKELLRIFLRVSQMENTVLRRMNLPAFLMVPVQRITRYPLLLSRLLKVTPVDHFSRDDLQSAHEKIEQHLEHMNKATREVASVKLWRRISIINGNTTPQPRRNNELEGASVSIRKMAIDVLDWTNLTDITCVIDNELGVFNFNGKPLRGIYACLLVRGKDLDSLASKMDNEMFFPPSEDIVKEVKLILVRVKNTRFCLLREPLCLSKCVVSQGENEFQDFVEINEITSKNTYFLQGMDKQGTATWLKYMQCYSMCVGQWRKRRDGLANIMMNGMLKHL